MDAEECKQSIIKMCREHMNEAFSASEGLTEETVKTILTRMDEFIQKVAEQAVTDPEYTYPQSVRYSITPSDKLGSVYLIIELPQSAYHAIWKYWDSLND